MSAVTYSTIEVCRAIGIHRSTILRWLQSGRLAEPRHLTTSKQDIRVWGARDIARARRVKEQMDRVFVPGRAANKLVRRKTRRTASLPIA